MYIPILPLLLRRADWSESLSPSFMSRRLCAFSFRSEIFGHPTSTTHTVPCRFSSQKDTEYLGSTVAIFLSLDKIIRRTIFASSSQQRDLLAKMNYDPLDTCPYDSVHRILRSRMQFHLTKCAKQHPCSKMKQCLFDARHVVPEVEHAYHQATCPARESVAHYQIIDEEAEAHQRILPIEPNAVAPLEENWEDDVHESYNPNQHIEERPVLRMVVGASKAERKQFRRDERMRFQQFEGETAKNENTKGKVAGKSTSASTKFKAGFDNTSEQIETEYKPLRRPKKPHPDNKNKSETSVNSSTAVKQNEKFEEQNATIQLDKQTINKSVSNTSVEQAVPFSYASALNKKSSKVSSNDGVLPEKSNGCDNKENSNDNDNLNGTTDDIVIEKLSRTFDEMAMGEEGHEKKSKTLDEQLLMLSKSSVIGNSPNTRLVNSSNMEKKASRVAANFPNFK